MQTLDHDVLQRLAIWLTREERPWLCTIVRTSGSSPRPVGSMLGVLEAGEQVGTVSGGCVEEDLLERIGAGEFSGESPKLVEYGVSALENERLGLPCGGKLVLLIEQLNTGDSTYRLVAHALSPGKIVTPVYLGQRGHPVGFDQGYFHTLKNLCGDEGARKLINANWIQLTCAWAL